MGSSQTPNSCKIYPNHAIVFLFTKRGWIAIESVVTGYSLDLNSTLLSSATAAAIYTTHRPVQSESLRLVSSESVPSKFGESGSDEIGLGVCGVRGGRGPGGVDRVRTVRVCGCGSGGGVHGSIDDNAPVDDDAQIDDDAPIVAHACPLPR